MSRQSKATLVAIALLGALAALTIFPVGRRNPRVPQIVGGQVVSGQISFSVNFNELVSSGVILPFDIPEQISANLNYSNGTASNQVDTIYAAKLSLSGSPQTLNLGSLTDPDGNSIVFARVRELIVVNAATAAGYDLKVEAGASSGVAWLPPSSNPLYARYGGSLRVSDPVSSGGGNGNVITGGAGNLTIDPGSNTFTVYLLIIGGSAAFAVVFVPARLRRHRRLAA